MKKLWLLFLVVLAGVFVLSYLSNLSLEQQGAGQETKKTILRAALIADSHNDNDLLNDALRQAQGKGVNFVIGLGDYTNLGTLDELEKAKETFEASKLDYYLTAGDRDGWESRNLDDSNNFEAVFGQATQVFERENIRFVLLNNSDIYTGISQEDWELIDKSITGNKGTTSTTGSSSARDTSSTLTFVFVHKTPFHPESEHIMGVDSKIVARQADKLIKLIEERKIDGLFSGDLHFFARFNSPNGSVRMTTVGAVSAERNFQGPRFGILTVFDDYSWEVEDVEIR